MSQGLTSTRGGDAASIFQGMELRPQFSPIFELSSGSLVGASLELSGPKGTNFDSPRALRRTATLMEQRTVLDSRKFAFADSAAARRVSAALPLFLAVDIEGFHLAFPEVVELADFVERHDRSQWRASRTLPGEPSQ